MLSPTGRQSARNIHCGRSSGPWDLSVWSRWSKDHKKPSQKDLVEELMRRCPSLKCKWWSAQRCAQGLKKMVSFQIAPAHVLLLTHTAMPFVFMYAAAASG